MATALAPTTGSLIVRWVDCSHKLGSLPCMKHKPHSAAAAAAAACTVPRPGFQDDE